MQFTGDIRLTAKEKLSMKKLQEKLWSEKVFLIAEITKNYTSMLNIALINDMRCTYCMHIYIHIQKRMY